MKFPSTFRKIEKQHAAHEIARRGIIARANEAISCSKRAIFALHREDVSTAQSLLEQAKKRFTDCERTFHNAPDLRYEGAYRAALEENAEALLFQQYLQTGRIGEIDQRVMDPSIYLAGLSDASGEIVRYTIRQITRGKRDEVANARAIVEMIIEFMIALDATGYLRTKFDQAKGNLKRLEDISYDLAIRQSMDISS